MSSLPSSLATVIAGLYDDENNVPQTLRLFRDVFCATLLIDAKVPHVSVTGDNWSVFWVDTSPIIVVSFIEGLITVRSRSQETFYTTDIHDAAMHTLVAYTKSFYPEE
jgi:hypothetical protein